MNFKHLLNKFYNLTSFIVTNLILCSIFIPYMASAYNYDSDNELPTIEVYLDNLPKKSKVKEINKNFTNHIKHKEVTKKPLIKKAIQPKKPATPINNTNLPQKKDITSTAPNLISNDSNNQIKNSTNIPLITNRGEKPQLSSNISSLEKPVIVDNETKIPVTNSTQGNPSKPSETHKEIIPDNISSPALTQASPVSNDSLKQKNSSSIKPPKQMAPAAPKDMPVVAESMAPGNLPPPTVAPMTPGNMPPPPPVAPMTPENVPPPPPVAPIAPENVPPLPTVSPMTPGNIPSPPPVAPMTPGNMPPLPHPIAPMTPSDMPPPPPVVPMTPGDMPPPPPPLPLSDASDKTKQTVPDIFSMVNNQKDSKSDTKVKDSEEKVAFNTKLKYANITSPSIVISYNMQAIEPSSNDVNKLSSLVKSLKSDKNLYLKIIGYSSELSKDDDTMLSRKLSLQRVINIRKYMLSQGINPERMTIQAAGIPNDNLANKDRVDIFTVNN
jgi:outer membrane protein OmpA-like peptidoglycan-associated protein